jgi:Tol biopolymer transport system component
MPDGAELVYAAGSTPATSSLWRVRASGGAPRRVAGIDVGGDPAVSRPRGQGQWSRLAFARGSIDSNVWRLPMKSGKPGAPEQVVASTRRDFEPRYSPDGARIAFTSDRSGYSEVWASNADGSAPVQVSSMRAITTGCGRWSPDGRLIVFCSNATGSTQLYLIDPNGGAARRLTNSPGHDTAPSWSRDGKWIYFASNRTGRFEVWKTAPEPGATPVQLSTHGAYAPLESWDGKTLYFANANQGPQIVSIPASGGQESPLPVTANTWGDWDVTPEGIVFVPLAARQVCFYSFVSKQTRTLAELPHVTDFGLSVSPKDGSILYSLVDHESSELELVDHFR